MPSILLVTAKLKIENWPRLRMKILERRQWRRFGAFIIKCEHISDFVLIVDFE